MSRSARTWPYLRATEDRLLSVPWHLESGGGAQEVGESLETWEPSEALRFRRRLVVDVDGVLKDCALPPGTPLRVAASWHSEGTYLKGSAAPILLPTFGRAGVALRLAPAAGALGGKLHLHIALVLGAALAPFPLRAHRLGTILWAEVATLALEGAGSRFPIEAISFKAEGIRFPDGAAWRLDWDESDLELPVLGSVRLYLNEDHAMVQRLLSQPEDPLSEVIRATLEFEVARLLLEGALRQEEFMGEQRTWPADSVGRAVERLIKGRFPRQSKESLKATLDADAPGFAALIQDRLGLFRGMP